MESYNFPLTITYRRTRRISLRVGVHGNVSVSVPIGCPIGQVYKFIDEHISWIEGAREGVEYSERRRAEFFGRLPLATRAQRDEATLRLKTIVMPMVSLYSTMLGVEVSDIVFTATKSKWGSCFTRARRLQFSLYLLLLPEWCVEHVVVHEVIHLVEPSHNEHFHHLMDIYFPRWREARATTRKLCRMGIET